MNEIEQIKANIQNSKFLYDILMNIQISTKKHNTSLLAVWSEVACALRTSLKNSGLIKSINYTGNKYWNQFKGDQKFSFVDGGSLGVNVPMAAPIGVRVGSYGVFPGNYNNIVREEFAINRQVIADLFDQNNSYYDDQFDDLEILRESARIINEISVVEQIIMDDLKKEKKLRNKCILLHGPLVMPVSRYVDIRRNTSKDHFPKFKKDFYKELVPHRNPKDKIEDRDRHYIPTYKAILNYIQQSPIPVYGVVERPASKKAPGYFTKFLLKETRDNGLIGSDIHDEILETLSQHNFTDAILYDFILFENEYIQPTSVNRQLPDKGTIIWDNEIDSIPRPFTTFMKITNTSPPLRIEWLSEHNNINSDLEFILHNSRLMPNYAFPVGLDIVDKHAKVPLYLSKGIQQTYVMEALKVAHALGDQQAINFTRKLAASHPRDFYWRPKAY